MAKRINKGKSKDFATERTRRYFEPGENDEGQRSRPERDRDAIIYTTALRRLAGVTQVVSPSEGHIYHNRLTHTIEVAQIARRLAEYLNRQFNKSKLDANAVGGLDVDVVEAAALAHDLGHPPFGHVAEKTLNRLVKSKGLGDGYEGNAQAFRIITKLCVRHDEIPGLNLTRSVLNAVLKYPWKQSSKIIKNQNGKPELVQEKDKWGYYSSEEEYFDFARSFNHKKHIKYQSLEAQIMDLSDDIAYAISDTEDFFRAGLIPLDRILGEIRYSEKFVDDVFSRWEIEGLTTRFTKKYSLKEFRKAFIALCKSLPILENYSETSSTRAAVRGLTSQLIGRYIMGTTIHSDYTSSGSLLDFPDEFIMEIKMLKELTWQYVIKSRSLAGLQHGQKRVIENLFTTYCDALDAEDPDHWGILPARDKEMRMWLHDNEIKLSDTVIARLSADAVASMTDQQALQSYNRLTGVWPGGAFEIWTK